VMPTIEDRHVVAKSHRLVDAIEADLSCPTDIEHAHVRATLAAIDPVR
jgi:hypothetical protein